MSCLNSLIKIDIPDRQDVFLITSYDVPKKHLRITLLDLKESKAYSGSASEIDLMRQAALIHMVFSDFISLTLKALTKSKYESKHDNDKFLYCLEENCENIIFQWKSVDEEETIINIGSVNLIELHFKSIIKEVFVLLSEEFAIAQGQLARTNENLSDLKKEMEKSKQLLTDVNGMKERVENELYSKFTLVLNEKKQEIKNLKRKMAEVAIPSVSKRQTTTVRSRKTHHISDSSDEGVDEPVIDIARPSTSKCNNTLLFFDDEPEMVISPSKKRIRNHCTVSKIQEDRSSKSKVVAQIVESESEDELFNDL